MPTDSPLQTWKPVPMRHYPHMMDADAILWDQFIRTNPLPQAKLIYDLHVGTPALPIKHYPHKYIHMVQRLSTLRIDVVALMPSETLVFEVKPRAELKAIGQAYCYALLVHRDIPTFLNPVPVILTDKAIPDAQWLCDRLSITLIELH